MEKSKIQWTEHTGGPWLGCSMVSAGCTNCYAMELAQSRLGQVFRKAYINAGGDWVDRPVWGDKAPRVLTKGFWNDARRINAAHAKAGTHGRWFPSMIDWLDKMPAGIIDQNGKALDPIKVLADFLRLVKDTPNLTWLLLTKRPENFSDLLHAALRVIHDGTDEWISQWLDGDAPKNVRIGASTENQEQADERIPHLLNIPAGERFLSVEPMLGPVDLFSASLRKSGIGETGSSYGVGPVGIHWVIYGGESGPKARPCNIDWIRDGVRQCRAAGVAPFVKQLGAFVINNRAHGGGSVRSRLVDPKGGDPAEWPEDLRIREFPEVVS